VVFAHPEHVEPDLIGKLDLFHEVAQALMRCDRIRPLAQADIGECMKAEFHGGFLSRLFARRDSDADRLPPVRGR